VAVLEAVLGVIISMMAPVLRLAHSTARFVLHLWPPQTGRLVSMDASRSPFAPHRRSVIVVTEAEEPGCKRLRPESTRLQRVQLAARAVDVVEALEEAPAVAGQEAAEAEAAVAAAAVEEEEEEAEEEAVEVVKIVVACAVVVAVAAVVVSHTTR